MESNKNNSVTLTQKRIASAKGLHIVCSIVAMLLNILAFVVLALNVTVSEIMFLVFPLALSVLDVLFLVKAILSNYRFKYAVSGAVIHSVTVLLISALAYAVMGMLEKKNGIVFVSFSMYAMLIVHVAQSIATLATALYATKSRKGAAKVCGVLFTVVFLVCAGIYGRMLLVDGYFGQGGYADYRTVVYKYDEQNKSYTAIDVLDGYGTDVVIPHQFNGSHVLYIDCALFSHEELTSVEVAWADKDDCNEKLGFVGVEHLNFLNPELRLLAPRGYMDGFRKALYTLSQENNYALELANHVYPSDLKENEVYISFGYDAATLNLVGAENIIPVWIKEKGTSFNVREHAGTLDYIANSDALDPQQLYWCHNNLQEKIFKCIEDANGAEVTGAIEKSIVNASVVFEKLYHLEIMEDNEAPDKTTIKGEHRYMWAGKEMICKYIITTAGNMQAKLDAIKPRAGFTLAWFTGTEINKHELESLEDELSLLDASGKNTLTVYPEWTLLPPTIDSITAGGSASGFTAVYGSNVELGSAATPPAEGISLKYEWFYEDGDEPIATANAHTLKNIYPEGFAGNFVKAGTYKLKVTAGNDDTTKLFSTAEKTIEVGFKKKTLGFNWVLPTEDDLVYSASSKNSIIEQTTFVAADVINGDTIEYSILGNGAKLDVQNAGKYELKLELAPDTALLYEIEQGKDASTIEIEPYKLDVAWGTEDKFTYNGNPQAPVASVTGLTDIGGNAEKVSVIVLGAQKNYAVNGYTATAKLDEENPVNKNYVLKEETTTKKFDILRFQVSIQPEDWDKNTFVYNSEVQSPLIKDGVELTAGETFADIDKKFVNYSGQNTDAGSGYVVGVSLSDEDGCNYIFVGAIECDYSITPADLHIKLDDKTMTYDNVTYVNSGKSFTFTFVGDAKPQGKDDWAKEIFSITYGNAATDAVNSGVYEITATISTEAKAKAGNYNIEIVDNGELTINKRSLTITIKNENKIYDGKPFVPGQDYFTVEPHNQDRGLATGDDITTILALDYKGNYKDAVNSNSSPYTVDADLKPWDEDKFNNYDVKLEKGSFSIKQRPIKFQAFCGNGEKIYDGKPAPEDQFGYIVLVDEENGFYDFVDGESFGAPIYSGNAKTYKNVGTYALTVDFERNGGTIKNYDVKVVTYNYTIKQRPLTVTLENFEMTYNGSNPNTNNFSYTVKNLVDGENLGVPTYNKEAVEAVNVKSGGYELTITGFSDTMVVNNYDIEYIPANLMIKPKNITVSVSTNLSKVYDGVGFGFKPEHVTIIGLEGTDTNADFEYEFLGGGVDSKYGNNCYSISVKLSGNDNYVVTEYVNGELRITPKRIVVKADSKELTYNATPYTAGSGIFTASTENGALVGETTLKDLGTLSFGGSATENAIDVGTYAIEVEITDQKAAAKNYIIEYESGELVITKKTVTIKAENAEKTYDGKKYEGFGLIVEGLIDGHYISDIGNVTFTCNAVTANEEGHNIYVSFTSNASKLAKNYDVKYGNAGKLIIHKAPLTLKIDDKTHTYNNLTYSNTNFTYNATGFVNGENISVLGTVNCKPYVNGVAVSALNAGTYEIRASVSGGSNYDITVVPGTLTINKRSITIIPDAKDKVYDGKDNMTNFSYTIGGEGFAVGHNIYNLGTIEYYGDADKVDVNKDAPYTLKVRLTKLTVIAENYNINCDATASFNITPAKLTVTAVATDKVYDGTSNNTFSVNVEGLVNGEAIAELGYIKYGGTAVGAVEAGTYTLTAEITSGTEAQKIKAGNYVITYVPCAFSINVSPEDTWGAVETTAATTAATDIKYN